MQSTRIPTFPDFVAFVPEMREEYEGFIKNFYPHGDFTFNNILNWLNIDGELGVARCEGNVVLRFDNTFDSFRQSYTVLGNHNPEKTLLTLFDFLRTQGQEPVAKLVPDYFVNAMTNTSKFILEEDWDNTDYIYNVKQVTEMEGPEFRGFRRQINFYLKNYAHDTRTYLHKLHENPARLKLINAMHRWDKVYDLGNDHERLEGKSISRALTNHDVAPFESLVIESENEIDGFSMFQYPPQRGYAVINYLKCSYEKKALFDFIFYCTVSYLQTQGIKWVNFEQDLGKQGIRFHKQRLNPYTRLIKYTIKPA